MTKVTAAYAISRTTRKVAYFDIREDKNIFFLGKIKVQCKEVSYSWQLLNLMMASE